MSVITPFYCEENIYNFIKSRSSPVSPSPCATSAADLSYVIFITNPAKMVLVRQQIGGDENESFRVVWDYHVVACFSQPLQRSENHRLYDENGREFIVADFNSKLGQFTKFDREIVPALVG